MRERQGSQTGTEFLRTRGLPQVRQSPGNRVVTRSSAKERKSAAANNGGLFRARLSGDPALETGGVPGETWSVLSFRLSLKMHLNHSGLQAAPAAPMTAV